MTLYIYFPQVSSQRLKRDLAAKTLKSLEVNLFFFPLSNKLWIFFVCTVEFYELLTVVKGGLRDRIPCANYGLCNNIYIFF